MDVMRTFIGVMRLAFWCGRQIAKRTEYEDVAAELQQKLVLWMDVVNPGGCRL